MIRLTGKSGLAIYVNPDKIIGFIEYVNNGGTFINYGDDSYVVTESPEEVVRKIRWCAEHPIPLHPQRERRLHR